LGFLPPDRKIVVVGSVAAPLLADERFRRWEGINRSRIRFTGVIPGADLAALLALAQVIILPITAGGGSNVKTAEALHAGRHVVGTALAFRGFERFLALPGVYPHDDPAGFKQRLLEQLEAPPPSGDNAGLRRDLSWSTTLHDLPSVVRALGGAG
jgi:glycosyltransferase involved in cell wall biosynthesis